jgi:hypothetical protein
LTGGQPKHGAAAIDIPHGKRGGWNGQPRAIAAQGGRAAHGEVALTSEVDLAECLECDTSRQVENCQFQPSLEAKRPSAIPKDRDLDRLIVVDRKCQLCARAPIADGSIDAVALAPDQRLAARGNSKGADGLVVEALSRPGCASK